MRNKMVTRYSVCAVLAAMAVLGTSGFASAASSDDSTDKVVGNVYDLGNVVVTASGYEQEEKNAPASVSVITAKDLAQKGYTDLRQALSDVEGVDVRGSDGRMGTPSISIRGMDPSYTVVLVDGVPQNGASAESIGPNGFYQELTSFTPPAASIDRIEVIRGPLSTLYGSDALGGVVNIITKKIPTEAHTDLGIQASFYPSEENRGSIWQYSLNTSGPLSDTTGFALRGNFLKRNASYTDDGSTERGADVTPAPMKNYNIGGRFSWRAGEANTYWIDGSVGRVDMTPSAEGDANAGMRFDRKIITFGAENEKSYGIWHTNVTYNTTQMHGYEMDSSTDERELKDSNFIIDSRVVTDNNERHKVTAGVRYWREALDDDLLKEYGNSTLTSNTWEIYGEDTWAITDRWAFTYGARFTKPDNYDSAITPRGYLVYKANSHWTIKGGVSTGFKAPTLSEATDGLIGYSGGWASRNVKVYGNSSLQPEKSVNKEIGFYYSNEKGASASLTLFDTYYKNKIDTEQIDAYTMSYINTGRGKAHGVEIATKLPLSPVVDLKLNYTFTTSAIDGGENDGAPLTSTPKHAVHAKLSWHANDKTTWWLGADYINGMARYSGSALSATQQAVVDALGSTFKPYLVFNLGVMHQFNDTTTLTVGVNNLLNKDLSTVSYVNGTAYSDYYSSGKSTAGTYLPSRNYWVSLNFKW